jgi:flagellar hook-length control protein FliK
VIPTAGTIPELNAVTLQAGLAEDPDATAGLDPAQASVVGAGDAKAKADSGRGSAAKGRHASAPSGAADATHASTIQTATNPGQAGKPIAAPVQPANPGTNAAANGALAVLDLDTDTAAGTNVAPGTAVGGDSAFSSWSPYLGSGGTAGGLSARQSAFIAQLRQNLPTIPAHEQIAVQIQNAMQNGSSRLTLDLQPAELGRVEIRLNVDKDKNVTATVVVDRPATLDLLQRDAKALERALQDAGLQTGSGSLSFSLRDSGGQGGGDPRNAPGGTGTGGNAADGAADTTLQPARPDVVATADGYADLET